MAAPYRVPEASELVEGLAVQWLHTPRGGYGYVVPVPATVAKASGKNRVTIDALKRDGSTARRSVRRGSLRVSATAKASR